MSQTFACLWFKQGFFAIALFEKMSESFELREGMEELYFQDEASIPGSDDSAGRNQHYVESYVYEPEEELAFPGDGSNQETTEAEVPTAQLPVTLSGCFVTASGKCVHLAGCHHSRRAEVSVVPVKVCQVCFANDLRRLPYTSDLFLDWNNTIHLSRVCEEFQRRRSPLSEFAVKKIVKKCRQCF